MKYPLLFVVGLICGLVILGVGTVHQSMLILALPMIVYLFSAILARPEDVKLAVHRHISAPHARATDPVTVQLTVTNEGDAIDELWIWEVLPEGVRRTEGQSSTVAFIPKGGKIELEYTLTAERGRYDNYPTLTAARDFSGLFEAPLICRTTSNLTILPSYPRLGKIKIQPPQTRGFAGPIASRQGGTGIGFWSVREYQAGDPQRRINWKLTARSTDELFTNVFEQERVADIGIILDARQPANVVTAAGSLFEHSVSAAAALAATFLKDGNRVSLLIYGSGLDRVFPGYGKNHLDRILRTLAKAKPELNYALESLNYLPTRIFPAKSQIVMVSPLLPDDIAVLSRMRSFGYDVTVVSPDPVSFSADGAHDSLTWAYRFAYAERNATLRQVRRSGVRLVNWHVRESLDAAIRETNAHQPQRGNLGL